MCILCVSSLCRSHPGPLRHWRPPPVLQRQASGSSAPHPRRNPLPPAVWTVLLSCASPADRHQMKSRLQALHYDTAVNCVMSSSRVFTYFYRLRLGLFFILILLLLSEVHLHSTIAVFGLRLLRFLLFLGDLGLLLYLPSINTCMSVFFSVDGATIRAGRRESETEAKNQSSIYYCQTTGWMTDNKRGHRSMCMWFSHTERWSKLEKAEW